MRIKYGIVKMGDWAAKLQNCLASSPVHSPLQHVDTYQPYHNGEFEFISVTVFTSTSRWCGSVYSEPINSSFTVYALDLRLDLNIANLLVFAVLLFRNHICRDAIWRLVYQYQHWTERKSHQAESNAEAD
jgi:hypothetical protein